MNLKELLEKRAALQADMKAILDMAKTETRSLTEEESTKFDGLEKEIRELDNTIKAIQTSRELELDTPEVEEEAPKTEERSIEQREYDAFDAYLRGKVEERDDNITKTDNGAIVPKTIANKIVDRVKDISPLFKDAEKFNVKGTVSIPYVDAETDGITVAYATEFEDLEAKSAKLLSVDLTGYLAGVLSKISKSLLNSTDVDLVSLVVEKMATAVATFIDGEILKPSDAANKIKGLSNVENTLKAGSTSAITADNLIVLKDKLKSVYQDGAYWVMAPATLTAIRLLKDGNQRYLFNDDVTEGFSGTILGKPVYVTDQCAGITSGANAVFYINPAQALAVKLVEDSVQILQEKYAAQHAIGIVNFVEVDAKIQNQQAVAALVMEA